MIFSRWQVTGIWLFLERILEKGLIFKENDPGVLPLFDSKYRTLIQNNNRHPKNLTFLQ